MRRDFQGLKCIYCQQSACASEDHVIARKLFAIEERGELPKAPACKECNCQKSELENYVLSVLPFGSHLRNADETLQATVSKRLKKNQKLHRSLSEGRGSVWTQQQPGAVIARTMTLPVDAGKIARLFQFIILGLSWDAWKLTLEKQEVQDAVRFLNETGDVRFRTLIKQMVLKRAPYVQRDLASGTFQYEGILLQTDSISTFWRFKVLGGVCLASSDPSDGVSTVIAGATGPLGSEVWQART